MLAFRFRESFGGDYLLSAPPKRPAGKLRRFELCPGEDGWRSALPVAAAFDQLRLIAPTEHVADELVAVVEPDGVGALWRFPRLIT